MTTRRTLAHNHDFTALWVGQTVSELGSRMSMFVFPLLAYALTHSPMLASLAEGAFLLGNAIALLPGGVLADRLDRRRVMRVASGSGVLLYASLAVAGALHHLTIPHLVVVGFLTGLGSGAFMPAESSAVRAVVPTEDLATALSQNQARQHVASLLGAPLGGVLYAATRWLPFVADAASFAVSWVLLGRIRTDLSAPARPEPTRIRDDLREGFAFIWSSPFFRTLTIWSSLCNLLINALFFVAILRLVVEGFHPGEIGLVETAAGLGGIIGAVLAPSIIARFATGWLTVMIAWSFVPLLVPLVFWSNPAVVAGALFLGLLLNPAGNAGIGAYRVAVTPDRLQGRVSAASSFCSMAAMPLAPILGGLLLGGLGGPTAIAVLALATGLAALIVTTSRSIRSVPRPVVWQADLARAASQVSGNSTEEGARP